MDSLTIFLVPALKNIPNGESILGWLRVITEFRYTQSKMFLHYRCGEKVSVSNKYVATYSCLIKIKSSEYTKFPSKQNHST